MVDANRRRRKRRDSTRPGAVVTGTFAHVSNAVIDLQIEGQPKPIGSATTHPFQPVDRQDFVEAGQLQQGERVQLYNGETKRVVQKLPRPGPVNVYNLEVYAERVYRVTPDGVLAHNACKNHEHHIVMKGAFSHWKEENRIYVKLPQKIFGAYDIKIDDDYNKILDIPNRGHSIEYAKTVCYHILNAFLLGYCDNQQVEKYVRQELINLRRAIYNKRVLKGVLDAKFATYEDGSAWLDRLKE